MDLTSEIIKEEAVQRMQIMGIDSDAIELFDYKGVLRQSKPPKYTCEPLEAEQLSRIQEFETSHHTIVYFVVRCYTSIGTMDAFLYVSGCPDEWESEREKLLKNNALAYVYNYDKPNNSGVESIKFESTGQGGLRRTA